MAIQISKQFLNALKYLNRILDYDNMVGNMYHHIRICSTDGF